MYQEGDFDLAGFAVGIAEKSEMNRIDRVKAGDLLVALPSSGIHSNGYSLARKLFFEKLNMSFDTQIEGEHLIDILLKPTRIYVKTFKALKNQINALAHITGGGIVENLPRVLPQTLNAKIEKEKIRVLDIFKYMSHHVEEGEMYRTFNMGVGMILVVSPENVDTVLDQSDGYVIGSLEEGEGRVQLI